MRANNQKVYMPREGKLISDINKVRRGSRCRSLGIKHFPTANNDMFSVDRLDFLSVYCYT